MKKIRCIAIFAMLVGIATTAIFIGCKNEDNKVVEQRKEALKKQKSNNFILITEEEQKSMNPLDWNEFLQNDPNGTMNSILVTMNCYFIMHTNEEDIVLHTILGKNSKNSVYAHWRDRLSAYFDAIDINDFPITEDFQDGDELPINATLYTKDINVVIAVIRMCKKEKRDCVVTYDADTEVYKIVYEDK